MPLYKYVGYKILTPFENRIVGTKLSGSMTRADSTSSSPLKSWSAFASPSGFSMRYFGYRCETPALRGAYSAIPREGHASSTVDAEPVPVRETLDSITVSQ
jgi:hypothetical protein